MKMIRRAAVPLIALLVLGLAACSSTTTVNEKPAAPPAPASSFFNAQAVTLAGCKALAQWEHDPNAVGSEGDAHTSQTVQNIIHQSAGTQFASDLQTWVDDTDPNQAQLDSQTVDSDCAAVGMPSVIG